MDAEQALADLTEISSQIQAAVIFDDKGTIAASTLDDAGRSEALARGAGRLLEQANGIRTGDAPPSQLEAVTSEGSVFVVRDGKTRIAATTGPHPTVGLVFYDLKSALRQIEGAAKRPARERGSADAASGPAGASPAKKPRPAAQRPTGKVSTDAADSGGPKPRPRAATKKSAPPKKPAARKKPDAP